MRELRNVLERSWVLSGPDAQFADIKLWLGPQLQSSTPGAGVAVDASLPFKEAKEQLTSEFESRYLPDLLARADGNITHAAKHAGLSRRHLRALLVKHGLKVPGEGAQ